MFTVFAKRQFEHMTKFLSFLLFTVYYFPQKKEVSYQFYVLDNS